MALPATLQHPFPYAPPPPLSAFLPPAGNCKPPPPPPPPPPGRAPALAPPGVKKLTTNPYVIFCREQRPFLPTDLRNAEREQTLGMRMDCVNKYGGP